MLLFPFSLGLPLKINICLSMRTSTGILLLFVDFHRLGDGSQSYINQTSPIKVK
jgi:hypothetical protein